MATDRAALLDAAYAAGATNVSVERIEWRGRTTFHANVSQSKIGDSTYAYVSATGEGATWEAALAAALATARVSTQQIEAPQQRVAIAGAARVPRAGWRERMRGGSR